MASGCEFVLFSFQLVLSDQMYSGVTLENIIISELSCAAICADRGSCSSFFYKRDARNCFLLDVNITDHQKMTQTLGMRQYKKISSGLQSPSTAVVRDRTADHGGKQRQVSGGLQSPSTNIVRESAADHDGKQRQVSGGLLSSPTVTVQDNAANHDGKQRQVSGGLKPPSTAAVRDSAADHDGKQHQVSDTTIKCKACVSPGYVHHAKGNFCFKDWTTDKMVWKNARFACVGSGGMLMKANTMEKHRFFVSVAETRPNVDTLWLGAWTWDFPLKEEWTWVDGRTIVSDHWKEGGVDWSRKNNCLSYAWSQNGFKWDDALCTDLKGFFCEGRVKG